MKTIKERQLELLNDTINHFNSCNRAVNSEPGMVNKPNCTYSHHVNGGCAIGRLVTAELAEELDQQYLKGGSSVRDPNIFNKLPLEIQELGMTFLQSLQELHDGSFYWIETGLSLQGQQKVEELKKAYELNA